MSIYILKTKLNNSSDLNNNTNADDTSDEFYIETFEEAFKPGSPEANCLATDYTYACNCFVNADGYTTDELFLCDTWTRTPSKTNHMKIVGFAPDSCVFLSHTGIRPCFSIDLSSLMLNKEYTIKDRILTFPDLQYPQMKESNFISSNLEKLFQSGKLVKTGKSYRGTLIPKMEIDNCYEEYFFNGDYYVRAHVTHTSTKVSEFLNGEQNYNQENIWIKVEPIRWYIKNWETLPTTINPNGTGKDKSIKLKSVYALLSLNYNREKNKEGVQLWENSEIRAYLNGYNLHDEIKNGNGNNKYLNCQNYDYTNKGFIDEISRSSQIITKRNNGKEKKFNPYNFDFKESTNDKLLELYVNSGISIFLHGPSGVGKSERVKQLDPTSTRITLRPQMNPEEIDGTLDRATGNYIPPLWYTQLTEKCKIEPERNHVLFIDELTNVKPTVQSLVYSIVLDRAGKDGLWPLPKNSVIVAAGNESSDNLAAYPLTNALFRRFCHIYFKVDKEDWINWAIGVNKAKTSISQKNTSKNETRAKIHPAIVSFIMSRDKNVLNQELDEENPSIVTDPRKWEIASRILYSTNNPNALEPAIGPYLTSDFVSFVQSIKLSVQDVITHNYDEKSLKDMKISNKLATILGLLNANENQLGIIRLFISTNLGKEVLATFDSLWIGNDIERANIIATKPLTDINANNTKTKVYNDDTVEINY